MDRRSFLKAAAAAPCIFGLPQLAPSRAEGLFAQESDARPEWFKQALARMKERKLHGVVLIAPASEAGQMELGKRLWDLLDGDYPQAHELLLTGVFIVMTPALAEAAGVRKSEDKENRYLLDPEGKRLAADTRDPESLDNADTFTASFTPFLHGDSGERLKARANELILAAPEDVHKALGKLGSEEIETREWASGILLAWAYKLAPLYAWNRRTTSDAEVASRLKSIIGGHFQSLEKNQPGPRLPFGTRIPKFAGAGCGGHREVPEDGKDTVPMPACGMGRIDDQKVRMFLRFLTK